MEAHPVEGERKPEASSCLQVVAPLMDQWPQVESCLECSAKTLQFVQDVFFYAVKVGPSTPLWLNWPSMACILRH